MGYYYAAFAVDLKALRKLWGKKNSDLREQIHEDLEEEINDNYEAFEDDIVENGAPVLKRALYEIFTGKPTLKDQGFQYGYALELICRQIGKNVMDEEVSWFYDALNPLLKKARCPSVEQMMGEGVLPLKIPKPDDFPIIGTVEPAGCIAAVGALHTIRPMTKNDDALYCIDQVKGWFDQAVKLKRGLVTFVY